MKYFSLFSGIGGFELGIQQAYENTNVSSTTRYKQRVLDNEESCALSKQKRMAVQQPNCIGFSEIDKYAVSIYQKHFPNHKNYGDITKIITKTLPDFDLLVGGFPCQSFSIAGKRGGFSDTRGTLFFEIARIVKQKQPRLLLLENVKGLLSHDKGQTFTTIISTLDELGYDCQWQVLNSKNFGVPQNRERVFIIGNLRGTSRPEVFPIGEDVQPLTTKDGKQASDAVVSRTLTATDAKMHLDGNYIAPVLTPDRLNKRQNGRRFKENGEPSFTLTGQDRHGVYLPPRIRRLTPKECERLQGFPDDWTKEGVECPNECNLRDYGENCIMCQHKIKEISDTQRYKMAGNAVSVNVIKEVMKKLIK